MLGARGERFAQLAQQRAQIDQRAPVVEGVRFQPRQVEQVIGQRFQPLKLGQRPLDEHLLAGRVRLAGGEFEVGVDGGQRRVNLVGGVGDEAPQRDDRRFDAVSPCRRKRAPACRIRRCVPARRASKAVHAPFARWRR